MSAHVAPEGRQPGMASTLLALGATAALGSGALLVFTGAGGGMLEPALIGAGLVGAALVVLVALGVVDGLLVLALVVPMPAFWSSGDVRLVPAAPASALVLAGWWLARAPERTRLRTGVLPQRPALVFMAWYCVAGALSASPLVAAREILNLGVMVALIVAAVDQLAGDERRRLGVCRAVVAVAAACGFLAVLQAAGVIPGEFIGRGGRFHRAALGFGQPNALGLFLAVVLPLAAWTARPGAPARRWGLAALAAVSLGLIATFSRGSWLAVLAGSAALVLIGGARRVARIWAVTLVLAVVVDVATAGMIRDTVLRTVGDWVLEQRAALALAGVLMFLDHPFLGVGPGGYALELTSYASRIPWLWDFHATPHNAYVYIAAETGILGLAAWVVLLFALVRTTARRVLGALRSGEDSSLGTALLWSMGVLVASGFVGWPLTHGPGQAVVLLIALACTLPAVGSTGAGDGDPS